MFAHFSSTTTAKNEISVYLCIESRSSALFVASCLPYLIPFAPLDPFLHLLHSLLQAPLSSISLSTRTAKLFSFRKIRSSQVSFSCSSVQQFAWRSTVPNFKYFTVEEAKVTLCRANRSSRGVINVQNSHRGRLWNDIVVSTVLDSSISSSSEDAIYQSRHSLVLLA